MLIEVEGSGYLSLPKALSYWDYMERTGELLDIGSLSVFLSGKKMENNELAAISPLTLLSDELFCTAINQGLMERGGAYSQWRTVGTDIVNEFHDSNQRSASGDILCVPGWLNMRLRDGGVEQRDEWPVMVKLLLSKNEVSKAFNGIHHLVLTGETL